MKWLCPIGCAWDPTWERSARCPNCCGFTTPDRAEALRVLKLREPQRSTA